jgi:hypothetical protein
LWLILVDAHGAPPKRGVFLRSTNELRRQGRAAKVAPWRERRSHRFCSMGRGAGAYANGARKFFANRADFCASALRDRRSGSRRVREREGGQFVADATLAAAENSLRVAPHPHGTDVRGRRDAAKGLIGRAMPNRSKGLSRFSLEGPSRFSLDPHLERSGSADRRSDGDLGRGPNSPLII